MADANKPRLDWFVVGSAEAFNVGSRMYPRSVSAGYTTALALALDALARPHDRASADELSIACEQVAEALGEIIREDGHTSSLAGCIRAMIMDTAARISDGSGS